MAINSLGGPRCRGSLVSRCRVLGVSFCSSLTVVLFLLRAGQRVEPKAGLDDPTLAPMLGGSFQEQSSIPLVGEFGKGMMSEKGVSASLGGFARPSCPRSVSGHSEIGRSEYTTALVRNPCTTPVNVPLPGMSPWDMSTARMALRSDSTCVLETLAGSFPTFRIGAISLGS